MKKLRQLLNEWRDRNGAVLEASRANLLASQSLEVAIGRQTHEIQEVAASLARVLDFMDHAHRRSVRDDIAAGKREVGGRK